MPTYNAAAVADAVIAFKKGITLQQGRALRDNPIAMMEGEAGAPRLLPNAHPDFVAGATVIDRCSVPNLVATVTAGLVVVPFHFTAIKGCTLRFYLEWRRVSGATPVTVDILRDGVSAATATTTSVSFVTQTFDVAMVAGENMAFQFTSGTGNVIEYRNLQIRANVRGIYRV